MIKKMAMLVMVVATMTALALPASASANWKHHAQAIEANVSLGLTGNVKFEKAGSGVECQITSEAQFTANTTTGHVRTFLSHPTSDTSNCKGLGAYAKCQIHKVTPGLQWMLHTTVFAGQSVVDITTQEITGTLTGTGINCPVKHIALKPGTVIATPNQPETVSFVQLHGLLQAHI